MASHESNWKKFFGSKLFLFLTFFSVIMLTLSYANAFYKDYQVRQEIRRLQDEAQDLEFKKLKMFEILKYVKSDDFVEAKARSEFNMVKPGEKVAIVASPTVNKTDIYNGQKNNPMLGWSNLSGFIKWWKYFIQGER